MQKHVLISYKWHVDRPDSHWLFWLQKKLEAQGFQVTMSELRTPPKDTVSWVRDIQTIYSIEDKNIFRLEHDPGCLTILTYLEYLARKEDEQTVLLVAGLTKFSSSTRTPLLEPGKLLTSMAHTTPAYSPYIRLEGTKDVAVIQEQGSLATFDAKLVLLFSANPAGLHAGNHSLLKAKFGVE